MKIDHFAGYGGKVEMTLINETTDFDYFYCEDVTTVVIKVEGNHERGLCPYDLMDAEHWLLDKLYAMPKVLLSIGNEWGLVYDDNKKPVLNPECDNRHMEKETFTFRFTRI